MNKLRVVFDLDCTLFDFEERFISVFGGDHREFYTLNSRYPFKTKEIDAFVNDPDSYRDLRVFENMRAVMKTFYSYTYSSIGDYYILTSRPKHLAYVTQEELRKAFTSRIDPFPLDSSDVEKILGSVQLLGPVAKIETLQKIKPDFVFDDAYSVYTYTTLNDVFYYTQRHPWNKDVPKNCILFSDPSFAITQVTDSIVQMLSSKVANGSR